MALAGKLALITGNTRGIGRDISLRLAKAGCNVVVTGKTADPNPALPGTIYSVADEVEALGVSALPFQCDVRDEAQVADMVATAVKQFGRGPDILVNNSGAMFWKDTLNTPPSRWDLMMGVNGRGAYVVTRECLPHMIEQGWGHVVMQSPPLKVGLAGIGGRTAYMTSKLAMTLVALGVAQECVGKNVAVNTIWPVTLIESAAVVNHGIGTPEMWRKPDILTDSVMAIVDKDPSEFTGNELLDEPFLRSCGVTDFDQYQCVPGVEPPTMDKLGSVTLQ